MTDAEAEAQQIHDLARGTDPNHDQVWCWCCCLDCDFDLIELITGGSASS